MALNHHENKSKQIEVLIYPRSTGQIHFLEPNNDGWQNLRYGQERSLTLKGRIDQHQH